MENPASHQEFRHTCPVCDKPVRPGYKFCEVCGTRIPSLATCSKCGTQFIHPKKFCDLCGAPFILEEVPEPDADEVPEPGKKQIPEPDTDEVLEPDTGDEPEPDTGDEPEPEGEEIPKPAKKETPGQNKDEISEPDTDKLLEQYGEGYGDDETLESSHKPKPPSPQHPEAKTPARIPAPQRQRSSETPDDALFFVDTGPGPAKQPVNRIRIIGGGVVLIIILAVIFFIGLPMLTGNGGFSTISNLTAAEITPVPTIATLTAKPTPASDALVPQPTQTIPPDKKIFFQVQKNPITSKISVIFTGSAGVGSISSAEVRVTHADGSVTTGVLLPLKGISDIILTGSKEPDRVEIIAKMSSGETYRVYDDLVSFIQ